MVNGLSNGNNCKYAVFCTNLHGDGIFRCDSFPVVYKHTRHKPGILSEEIFGMIRGTARSPCAVCPCEVSASCWPCWTAGSKRWRLIDRATAAKHAGADVPACDRFSGTAVGDQRTHDEPIAHERRSAVPTRHRKSSANVKRRLFSMPLCLVKAKFH